MRKLLTLLCAALFTPALWGQSVRMATPAQMGVQLIPQPVQMPVDQLPSSLNATEAPGPPTGTVTTDAVTAIKIGEASNAYTFLLGESNQLATAATSGGGLVAFIARQNIGQCGGQTIDNGQYRFTYSTDGGTTWDVGSAGTSSPGNTPGSGCFGIGPINPLYTRASRFPSMAAYLPTGSTSVDDVSLIYTGPVLGATYPDPSATWDGAIAGVVSDINSATPTVNQEQYLFQNGNQYFTHSLVERVPGEYWYTAWSWTSPNVGTDIIINKGVLDPNTKQISWSVADFISPTWLTFNVQGQANPVTARAGAPQIAFSPSGDTGYVAVLGDIGFRDSVYSPIIMSSYDGGLTWNDPEELNMRQFSQLIDSLQSFWITVDTATGDTMPAGSGVPTCAFDFDLAVDKHGDLHLMAAIGNAGQSPNISPGRYTISSALRMFLYDFTRDSFGDWNMMYIGPQVTFRGEFGDPANPADGSGATTVDPVIQLGRSRDGEVVYFFSTDTDTVGNFGSDDNINPNLTGRAYHATTKKLSEFRNFTADDATWASRALLPKAAAVGLENNGVHTAPVVIMDQGSPGNSFINPMSFWYFSDITYDESTDFTQDPIFFYNCKQNPINVTPTTNAPDCGNNNGSLAVSVSGGLGSYTYSWSNGSDSASAVNLAAGVYTLAISDSLGCTENISYTVNNVGAPSISLDSISNVSCNGQSDGYLSVNASSSSSGIASYAWDNGGNMQSINNLGPGTYMVTVTDSNGCQSFFSETINEPSAITVSASATNLSCFGDMTASATSLASGGTGMLSFSWDNGAMTQNQSNLGAGTYMLTVTDENSCMQTASVTVSQPDSLALQVTVTANNTSNSPPYNGQVFVSFNGGTGQPTFDWTGPDGFTAMNTNFIAFLAGGTYTVTATDEKGCVTVDTAFVDGPGPNAGIADELAAGINQFSLYPNPSQGQIAINLSLAQREDVRVEVITFNGQTVFGRDLTQVLEQEVSFDLGELAAGMYLVKIRTERGEASRKLMLR